MGNYFNELSAILKGSTCLLWDILTEKSGLWQYAVCIIQNAYAKK